MVATQHLAVGLVVGLMGLLSLAPLTARPSEAATPASVCTLTSTGGTVLRALGSRSYYLYVPPGLAGSQAPLLLALHGGFLPTLSHAVDTGWREFALTHHFIVAFPSAVLQFWDDDHNSPDVTFLRNVVADISATWCVNPHRVHAEGHSRGANMSHRLACDAADVFASVSAYAGTTPALLGDCIPSRPISVGVYHGSGDVLVPWPLGVQVRDEWVDRNGCAPVPVSQPVSDGTLLRYTPCDAGVEVWWRLYPGQSHLWPKGQRGQDILNRMWTFFEGNPLP